MVSVKFRRREDKLIKKYDFQSLNIWGLKEFDIFRIGGMERLQLINDQ